MSVIGGLHVEQCKLIHIYLLVPCICYCVYDLLSYSLISISKADTNTVVFLRKKVLSFSASHNINSELDIMLIVHGVMNRAP